MPGLSIVVATYKMQREAPRTVSSLLPPLQRRVDDLDYEIVVVDNGSPVPLDLDDVLASAPIPVRLVRVSPDRASVSPVGCINDAVRNHATGDWLMICIDGARLASSHLVRRTADMLSRHRDAFTFVASRHLGPKLQRLAIEEGYNQAVEDELLDSVAWRRDLDNLYAASVWAGAHHRTNPLLQNESNAFAMTRETWDSMGGYNEGFSTPGGGFCNLELFRRYVTREGALNILLYGEATFHQVHNVPLRGPGYRDEIGTQYVEITGESYRRPVFPFLADLGETYDRMRAVGRYLLVDDGRAPPLNERGSK